jgi:hypothetical protein
MRAVAAIVVCSLIFVASAVWGLQKDDKGKDEKAKSDSTKKDAKAGSVADLASLYPQPTDAHKEITKADEGVWDATMKFYAAGPFPQEFKGTETIRAGVDGLFLISDFEADFIGGKKFRGHGISGYDPRKKKIVGVWADNMSNTIGTLEGDYEPNAKAITLWFSHADPMTGQMRKDKHVSEYKGDGHKLYTMYMAAPGGGDQQVKVMEVESKRRKENSETKSGKEKADAETKSAK